MKRYLKAKPVIKSEIKRPKTNKLPKEFYYSKNWREIRYEALVKYGAICMLCGARPPQVKIHVDHIKPKHRYPELAFKLDNLQILCESCNLGKGVRHEHDFRPKNSL